jgi:hypothetical protein
MDQKRPDNTILTDAVLQSGGSTPPILRGLKDLAFWFFQKFKNARIILQGDRATSTSFAASVKGIDILNRKETSECLKKSFHLKTIIDGEFLTTIQSLRQSLDLKNFVETGTYHGDTSLLMSRYFNSVYTCDIQDHPKAIEFFISPNINFTCVDSREFLKRTLPLVKQHSLFFLDAHWYEDWPIKEELRLIFNSCDTPVVVIDDFDTRMGVDTDSYQGRVLDLDLIRQDIPSDYRFFYSGRSYRNRGMLFLVPPSSKIGQSLEEEQNYDHVKHSLWP